MSRYLHATSASILALAGAFVVAGCGENPSAPATDLEAEASNGAAATGPYEFSPPVFDIAATPDGAILVAETVFPGTAIPPVGRSISTVKAIRGGSVREVAEISTVSGSPINGLAPLAPREFLATSGGLDQAVGAGVWHVWNGRSRLLADIEAFETGNDPDAFEGSGWKDQACEAVPPFTAGPQSNPYHLTSGGSALSRRTSTTAPPLGTLGGPHTPPAPPGPPVPSSGGEAGRGPLLVADAAGNTLYSVGPNGALDWVAVFTPPTADGSGSDDPADWQVLFTAPPDLTCYVQPVPTSVAVGPDGAYYVGELTGVTPAELGGGSTTGLSRVWRIEPGARNVVCPSADCQVALSGFTSVLDVAFGPDGRLYVVEYDEAGWFTAIGAPGAGSGGTVNRCDVGTGACAEVASGLILPSAITFDLRGHLWLLESNLAAPTVRRLD